MAHNENVYNWRARQPKSKKNRLADVDRHSGRSYEYEQEKLHPAFRRAGRKPCCLASADLGIQ